MFKASIRAFHTSIQLYLSIYLYIYLSIYLCLGVQQRGYLLQVQDERGERVADVQRREEQ